MTAPTVRLVARSYQVSIVMGGDAKASTILLHWTEEDPAAVWLTIEDPWAPEERVVEWVLARGLLVAACLPQCHGQWVGSGDAKVRHRGASSAIALGSPQGACAVVMAGEVLPDFLRAVAELMPLGCDEESEIIDRAIEAEVGAILRGAA